MTNSEFVHIQDEILQLSGRDLASALKRSPSDIVRWRKDVEIPSYIELLLHYLVKEKLGTLTLTLTVNDINAIIRLAAERGLTFEGLLISMIRSAITSDTTPAAPILFPADSLRVAEDERKAWRRAAAGKKWNEWARATLNKASK